MWRTCAGAGAGANLGGGVLEDDIGVLPREELRVPQPPAARDYSTNTKDSGHSAKWGKMNLWRIRRRTHLWFRGSARGSTWRGAGEFRRRDTEKGGHRRSATATAVTRASSSFGPVAGIKYTQQTLQFQQKRKTVFATFSMFSLNLNLGDFFTFIYIPASVM
jgi:hypothetical protein